MPIHLKVITKARKTQTKPWTELILQEPKDKRLEFSAVRANSSKERNVVLHLRLKES